MKRNLWIVAALLAVGAGICFAQTSGNVAYSEARTGRERAESREAAERVMAKEDLPPSESATFIEASVLMNVKADEYVAVFGVMQVGDTPADCAQKMDATIKSFTDDLKALGVAGADLYVDYIAEPRIYHFETKGDVATEKLAGFELKKNVSIHFQDPALLDKLTLAAAKSQIFDLIKVDYVVRDVAKANDAAREAAARVIKHKREQYENLLGVKLVPPAQIYAERPAIHYPTGMYDSYRANESEAFWGGGGGAFRIDPAVHSARKSETFYFNGLDGNGFDEVINPVITEPVVQVTLYLKLKYRVEQNKAGQ